MASADSGTAGPLAEAVAQRLREFPDYPSPGILFRDILPVLADPELYSRVVARLVEAAWPDGERRDSKRRDSKRPDGVAPEGRRATAESAKSRTRVDAVAGIESRGFLLGAPVALALGVPFVPVRKEGKLPGATVSVAYELEYGAAHLEMQQGAVGQSARVFLVDDLLATGGTAAAAADLIERLGATVTGIGFLVELSALNGRDQIDGYNVFSILVL